jgi:enoyl-[acyl-carrier protein] reductase I
MMLDGKNGLIVGTADEQSIAFGCAEPLYRAGADLAISYLNPKAESYVRPLAERLKSGIIVACDVREKGQLEAVFARIREEWGRLDFLLHSIAYAEGHGQTQRMEVRPMQENLSRCHVLAATRSTSWGRRA